MHLCRHGYFTILTLSALVFAGCATEATIKERVPSFKPLTTTAAPGKPSPATKAEEMIRHALTHLRVDPMVALGDNIQAAQTALAQLKVNPNDAVALHDYNFAVARIIGIIRASKLDPWSKPISVPSSNGTYLLTNKRDPRPMWNPTLYNFTPADEFTIGGSYVKEHVTRPGIGAPVVAAGKEPNKEWRTNYLTKKIYYGVTAVARFQGNRCVISFEDPLEKESVTVDGRTMDLAADFTVPLAVMLASAGPQVPKLERMLFPEKYAETAHLARLEPYNPNKAVLLVIHGLMDSPSTWAPLKGSEIATISLGRIGSMLIRTPNALLAAGKDTFKIATFHGSELKLKRAPNSIDTLSPKNRFVRMINKIPIVPGIPYHTIQGDRGRGDSPNSSDGVVPYWSSHMDGARSECIVPSDHSAHQNSEAFAEVARILKLNAEAPSSRSKNQR